MLQGYKKQVNSASQSGVKGRGSKEASSAPPDSVQHLAVSKHLQPGILGDYLGLLGARVGSFTFPAVWINSFLLLSQDFGLHGVQPPLLILHLLPLVTQDDTNGSVVLPRIHMCVLHSVLLGEEHEGIHWTLAFCRRGNSGCH